MAVEEPPDLIFPGNLGLGHRAQQALKVGRQLALHLGHSHAIVDRLLPVMLAPVGHGLFRVLVVARAGREQHVERLPAVALALTALTLLQNLGVDIHDAILAGSDGRIKAHTGNEFSDLGSRQGRVDHEIHGTPHLRMIVGEFLALEMNRLDLVPQMPHATVVPDAMHDLMHRNKCRLRHRQAHEEFDIEKDVVAIRRRRLHNRVIGINEDGHILLISLGHHGVEDMREGRAVPQDGGADLIPPGADLRGDLHPFY